MFTFRKNITFLIILALMLVYTTVDAKTTKQSQAETAKYATALADARKTTDSLLKASKAALLRQGSIKDALNACSKTGQGITSLYSNKTGYLVRRTSLKYRNPLNKPTRKEKRILKRFDELNKTGELKPGHENHGIIKKGKVEYLLYMRPLVTKRLCLNCHGTKADISPNIAVLIKKKYPKDKATGFSIGDVRGAVSVAIPLKTTH